MGLSKDGADGSRPGGPGQQGGGHGPADAGERPGGPGQAGLGAVGLGKDGADGGPGGQSGWQGGDSEGVEQTQPSPPRGAGGPARVPASAPSPADVQPTRPAVHLADGQQRPVAAPQRVGAASGASGESGAKRSKKWLLAAVGAVVLVVALIAAAVAFFGGADNSPEGQVRAVIEDYTEALRAGDLEALRGSTCGELNQFYTGITPEQFTGVHQVSTERGSIPVVSSVDAVRITGDTALAEATVHTAADPNKRTARTFDLQRTDGSWKVCDPAGTP
ncbi:hypothetical protein [Nocardia lasii]|uniref:DUF4878 domain-containing protein n=1 Tax=Nocardia lasii TaxID=1616107 RepID=A0ABW1JRQ9_9NOCA